MRELLKNRIKGCSIFSVDTLDALDTQIVTNLVLNIFATKLRDCHVLRPYTSILKHFNHLDAKAKVFLIGFG